VGSADGRSSRGRGRIALMFDEEEAREAYQEEVLTRHSSQEDVKK
jgi:hypothetical protein